MDKEDLINDLVRNDHGDKEISRTLDYLYKLHKQKGLPYVELMRSKFYGGTIRYIVKSHNGIQTISNLDNNEEMLTL